MNVTFGERHYGRGGRAFPLRAAEHRDIRLQLPRPSVVTGRIVTEGGNPASGASVRGVRFTMAFGYRRAVSDGGSTTDNEGVFRIDSLTPGDYAVCASTHETGPLNEGQRLQMEIDRQRRGAAYVLGPAGTDGAEKARAPAGGTRSTVAAVPDSRSRLRICLLWGSGLLLSSFAVSAPPGQSPTRASLDYATRVLPPGQSLSVGVPLTTGQLVPAIELLAWYARVPIGFEGLDDDPFAWAPSPGELQFAGDTLAEALEKIVLTEPRYRWSQENGVIHLRPRTALMDPNNLLNRPVQALELQGITLSQALNEVHFYLRPELRGRGIVGAGPGPEELGLRRFSVTVSRTTILGLLDAIVVAHGAASWHVTYTNDPQWPYQISFGTFDGWRHAW